MNTISEFLNDYHFSFSQTGNTPVSMMYALNLHKLSFEQYNNLINNRPEIYNPNLFSLDNSILYTKPFLQNLTDPIDNIILTKWDNLIIGTRLKEYTDEHFKFITNYANELKSLNPLLWQKYNTYYIKSSSSKRVSDNVYQKWFNSYSNEDANEHFNDIIRNHFIYSNVIINLLTKINDPYSVIQRILLNNSLLMSHQSIPYFKVLFTEFTRMKLNSEYSTKLCMEFLKRCKGLNIPQEGYQLFINVIKDNIDGIKNELKNINLELDWNNPLLKSISIHTEYLNSKTIDFLATDKNVPPNIQIQAFISQLFNNHKKIKSINAEQKPYFILYLINKYNFDQNTQLKVNTFFSKELTALAMEYLNVDIRNKKEFNNLITTHSDIKNIINTVSIIEDDKIQSIKMALSLYLKSQPLHQINMDFNHE